MERHEGYAEGYRGALKSDETLLDNMDSQWGSETTQMKMSPKVSKFHWFVCSKRSVIIWNSLFHQNDVSRLHSI